MEKIDKNVKLSDVLERALAGEPVSVDDALTLGENCPLDELCDAADKVREHWCGNAVDTCSIVNARSGRCSEDCKWCAQSAHHHTGIKEYEFIPASEAMDMALANSSKGVRRFSLVTSGRKVAPADM